MYRVPGAQSLTGGSLSSRAQRRAVQPRGSRLGPTLSARPGPVLMVASQGPRGLAPARVSISVPGLCCFFQTLITFVNKHLNKLNLEVTELETQVGHSPQPPFRVPHPYSTGRAFHPDPELFPEWGGFCSAQRTELLGIYLHLC